MRWQTSDQDDNTMMIAPYIGNDKLADDNTDGNTGHLICHLAVDMNGRRS